MTSPALRRPPPRCLVATPLFVLGERVADLPLAAAAALPFLPVAATEVPLQQLLRRIASALL